MSDIFANLDVLITDILNGLGLYGPLLGSILILVESMVPVLPLSVFITLNFYAFGTVFGFFISYILTVIGCNLAYYISKRVFSNRMEYLFKRHDKNKIINLLEKFPNMSLSNLSVLMAFPFTPAFMINILSGVSKTDYTKFLLASIIGKPFMVFFWGYIGVTLIESLTHPLYLVEIMLIMASAYIISKIISKKFNLE